MRVNCFLFSLFRFMPSASAVDLLSAIYNNFPRYTNLYEMLTQRTHFNSFEIMIRDKHAEETWSKINLKKEESQTFSLFHCLERFFILNWPKTLKSF